jgi:hypothetical protein
LTGAAERSQAASESASATPADVMMIDFMLASPFRKPETQYPLFEFGKSFH